MSIPTFWTSFRSSKWFKPALIVAGVAALLIAALLAAPILLDINTHHDRIVRQLEQRLGRTVHLGVLSLQVLPSVKVGVDQAAIGEDPQFAQGDFVKAKSIILQVGLGSLLRGNPEIEGIELIEPDVTVIKEKNGKWNWETLKPLQSARPDAAETAPFDLLVRDGRFTTIDRTAAQPTQRIYAKVNIALDNFSPHSTFDFTTSMTMPGDNAGKLEMSGKAGPIDGGDVAVTPVEAQVKMNGVDLAGLQSLSGLQTPPAGRLTLNADIKGSLSEGLSAGGKLAIEQLRLAADVEPSRSPLEAEYKLTAKKQPKAESRESDYLIKIDQGDLKIGKTRASVIGRIDLPASQPPVDLQPRAHLEFATIDAQADDLIELAGLFGASPDIKGSGAATLKAIVDATLGGSNPAMTINGQAAIARVIIRNLILTDVQTNLAFKDHILNLDPLSFNLYGGSYRGKAQLDQRRKSSDLGLNGHITGMDFNQFLSAVMKGKSVIYGRSDATINLQAHGGDQSFKSVAGNGALAISNGHFASFDLMKQVEVFGKLAGLTSGGSGTHFRILKTNFRLDRGRLTTNDLQIVMDDLQVTGNGVMLLGDHVSANYDLLAKLSPALSKRFAGGGVESESPIDGIGKFIRKVTSVAGNFFMDEGSIVVPLKMSGPIGDPSFSLNAEVMQKRATQRFVGKPSKNLRPEDAVKGVLDLFKKKQKP